MGLCQHWLFMHPQILHVKALTPRGDGLRGYGFGSCSITTLVRADSYSFSSICSVIVQ